MKKPEILLFAILGGFALTFLILSRDYNPTAALFPRFIAIASMIFLVAGIIVQKSSNMGSDPSLLDFNPATMAVQGGYVVLIYLIGFIAATLLYLIIAPIQLRYERRGVAVATSVILTLLLAGSFMWLFEVQLPPGAIWELL